MRCNEKSSVRLDEANIANGGWYDYPCYEEFGNMFSYCGAELNELLFEMYR